MKLASFALALLPAYLGKICYTNEQVMVEWEASVDEATGGTTFDEIDVLREEVALLQEQLTEVMVDYDTKIGQLWNELNPLVAKQVVDSEQFNVYQQPATIFKHTQGTALNAHVSSLAGYAKAGHTAKTKLSNSVDPNDPDSQEEYPCKVCAVKFVKILLPKTEYLQQTLCKCQWC